MDIKKERIAHEKHLLSQGVDFKYLPNIQYSELENVYELIEWDEEYSEALNEINSSWCTWQAAKAKAVPEWILVEDRLPSDGQNIIAFDAIKHCVFKGGEFLQGYIESDTGHEYEEPVEVTHWMAVEAQEPAND
ncbi:DUF551 domain-containing protein [Acinetobacter sp. YH16055]|uniref:DUF551 domain-containing protein n=1 Tax=Acinetobacter sp. YH16055 TaxID=2601193 RepID=UPI0015D3E7E7|nr:DUF551 domain-containing protein [Acinetobacter sp. YH16055]